MYRRGEITKQTNNQIKNKLNKDINNAKHKYFLDEFAKHKKNMKRYWIILNQISGKTKNKNEIVEILDGNNSLTSKPEIVSKFSDFFSNIALQLDNDLQNSTESPLQYLTSNPRSFFCSPVTESEVEKLILNSKITKTDVNQMPIKILKNLRYYVSAPLSKIINSSFLSGIFPHDLKLARITPIFKNGDNRITSNYRPIASLPFFSKIFERCMTNRLLSFFNKNSLFSQSQFGFLKNKSTEDAVIDLTEAIYDSLNSKKHHVSLMIDLKKAFDTVNHNILLKKLQLYGIRGIGLDWIRDYLTNRRSYVALGKDSSGTKVTNIGIPQGSVIGPILFIIYINDLPKTSDYLRATLFADDTTLSFSHADFNTIKTTLNTELSNVEKWTTANRLTINVNKTEMLLFSNLPVPPDYNNQIAFTNEILTFKSSCKFLGVLLDDKLNFSDHINYVISKISRTTGILYKIRNQLPIQARLNFYYSFVYPYLTYNITSWGGTNQTHLQPLIIQQKKIVRIMTNSHFLEHTTPLFHRLRLLKIPDIYELHLH